MARDLGPKIDWHWPRTHRGLIWGLAETPTTTRLQVAVTSAAGRQIVGETVRQGRRFVVGLGTDTPSGIEILARPPLSTKTAITLVDGPDLRPRLRDGSSLEVDWVPGSWHQVRARILVWEGSPNRFPQGSTLISAAQGQWRIPEGCPGLVPMELVLTPFDSKGRQGPTQSLIVPTRASRVEVRFRHVYLQQPGRGEPLRRLKIEAQANHPAPWPRSALVRWEPLRGGVIQEYPLVREPGRELAEQLLPSISLQGDKVSVHFEASSTGVDYHYIVEAIEQNGRPAQAVVLGQGVDRVESPAYEFGLQLPPGEPATILDRSQPLDAIPALVSQVTATPVGNVPEALPLLPSLPSAVLDGLIEVQADPQRWERVRTLPGQERDLPALPDYLRQPQVYHQWINEPHHAEVVGLWGQDRGSPPTVVHHLLHAWNTERKNVGMEAEAVALDRYLNAADDDGLDRWLRLVSAGTSPEFLREFLCVRRWGESDGAILRASLLLSKFRRQPVGSLLPELVPGTEAHQLVSEAARAEETAVGPRGAYETFDRAHAVRWTAIEVLIRHLDQRQAAGDRFAQHLGAAREALSRDLVAVAASVFRCEREAAARGSIDESPAATAPVLILERVLAERRRLDQLAREQVRGQVADWMLRLLEQRTLGAWPWSGSLTVEDPESAVSAVWSRVRDQILALPENSASAEEVAGPSVVLGKILAAATSARANQLAAILRELVANVGPVVAWLDVVRARTLLRGTILHGTSRLTSDQAHRMALKEQDAASGLINDPSATLAALAARARPVRVLIEDEAAWARDLARAGTAETPGLAALGGLTIDLAQTRLADPSLETALIAEEAMAATWAAGLDRLATRLHCPTFPRPEISPIDDEAASLLFAEESARLGRMLALDARLAVWSAEARGREGLIRAQWARVVDQIEPFRFKAAPGSEDELDHWFDEHLRAEASDEIVRAFNSLERLPERLREARWVFLLEDFTPKIPLPRLLDESVLRPDPGNLEELPLYERLTAMLRGLRSLGYLVGDPVAVRIDKDVAVLRREVGTNRIKIVEFHECLYRRGEHLFEQLSRCDPAALVVPRVANPADLDPALVWLNKFRTRSPQSEVDTCLAEVLARWDSWAEGWNRE